MSFCSVVTSNSSTHIIAHVTPRPFIFRHIQHMCNMTRLGRQHCKLNCFFFRLEQESCFYSIPFKVIIEFCQFGAMSQSYSTKKRRTTLWQIMNVYVKCQFVSWLHVITKRFCWNCIANCGLQWNKKYLGVVVGRIWET